MRALALAVVATTACGDPVWTGAYQGDPLLTLDCALAPELQALELRASRVGLVWLGADGARFAGDVDDEGVFPRFRVRVYAAAPAAARVFDSDDGRVAYGQLIVYDDGDGDGRFAPEREPIRGVSRGLVIVDAADGATFDGLDPLPVGLHALAAERCTEARGAPFTALAPDDCRLDRATPDAFFDPACPWP